MTEDTDPPACCGTPTGPHDDECRVEHDSVDRAAAWLLSDDNRLRQDAVGGVWALTDHKGWLPAPAWLTEATVALLTNGEIPDVPRLLDVELDAGEALNPDDPYTRCQRLGTCPPDGPHEIGCVVRAPAEAA